MIEQPLDDISEAHLLELIAQRAEEGKTLSGRSRGGGVVGQGRAREDGLAMCGRSFIGASSKRCCSGCSTSRAKGLARSDTECLHSFDSEP